MKWEWLRFIRMAVMLLVLEGCRWCTTDACLEHERIALLHLKPFFNDGNQLNSWVEVKGSDCCKWERVECNTTTRRLIQLSLNSTKWEYDMDNRNLNAWYLNASMFLPFEELKSLYLSGNAISGNLENEGRASSFSLITSFIIPLLSPSLICNYLYFILFYGRKHLLSLSELSSLRYLDLSHNKLEGSSHLRGFQLLSRLNNLETLDLSWNSLKNSILFHMRNLSSLKTLRLSGNELKGRMDHIQDGTQLRLTNLEELDLSDNLFRNNTISFLQGLSSLKSLTLSVNRLQGSLDTKGLSNLTNLKKLDLSGNQIESFQSFKDGGRKLELTHLEELNLDGNQFNTSVFASLNKLSNLKSLSIRSNQLKGSIDMKDLEAFINLRELYMSGNELKDWVIHQDSNVLSNLEEIYLDNSTLNTNILQSIGVFASLKTLSLSDCGLIGPLPNQGWCDLRNLEVLEVSENALEGMLPHYISRNHFQIPLSFAPFANLSNLKALSSNENKMFQLEVISLSKCITSQQLSRKVPTFLYYQYDLRYVDLSHNNLSGTLPTWLLENNTKLEELILKGNSFTGPLSRSSALISNVSSIDISENKLQGQIPTGICSTFPHLRRLFLSKNAFEGNIPLYLSNNQLYGKVPEELITKGSLIILRLSNNNFSGNVVPVILSANGVENLYLDGNNFSGEMTNVNASTFEFPYSLSQIDLSNNKLHGKLPRWIGNASFLWRLDLSNNGFEGSIPMEFCKLNRLEFLDLSQNNLSGSIPSCFNPPYIEHVHIHGNRLRGPLSLDFYNSSSIVTLDLRGNNLTGSIPKWIYTLSSLSVLLLKDNHFHGKVPVELCKLHSLSIIDLSQNMFSSPIPSCLGNLSLLMQTKKILDTEFYGPIEEDETTRSMILNLGMDSYYPDSYLEEEIEFTTKSGFFLYEGNIFSYMTGIDLSCNNLTGHIPPELGNLSEIHSLNLSHNKLTGVIPSSFAKLHQIESLDLSYNNLSGEIPNQLVELNSLEVFSVAYNNLSGSIPEKAQFGTFIENSYEGNPFLCGAILHKSCSKIDSPSTILTVSEDKGEDGLIGDFCVSFLVSYVVVLLTIFVVLYINPYWQRAWFSLVGKCITTCRYSNVGKFLTYHIFKRYV
ncbi:hypothetical protein ES288_D02G034100v1 [Gossypium darwinii]|uniref:Leucine-rich repeat-containing N-terminal plant-type domain-containing protein n=1 Tax=Gossypium darwinii TaxID=34276 RepID=A0A5D2DAT0_GOSDA|nr:hypothetical protein ES288_D02G034100v1 [Gossypium darwinii]